MGPTFSTRTSTVITSTVINCSFGILIFGFAISLMIN